MLSENGMEVPIAVVYADDEPTRVETSRVCLVESMQGPPCFWEWEIRAPFAEILIQKLKNQIGRAHV